jgi:hypothetical protein
VLFVGVVRSLDKRQHTKGKGWGPEYSRVFCVAGSAREAERKLRDRVPEGFELRGVETTSPSKVREPLSEVLPPDELRELEQDIPGRTLRRQS